MSELLPCPFCGSPGDVVESREAFPNMPLVYYPTCTREDFNYDCPAVAQPDGETNFVGCSYKTPEEAAAAWNTRHTPDGWQMMPVAFTEAMDKACDIEWTETDEWSDLYNAMRQAAPTLGGGDE